jgi:anti-anti-sigma factor
MLTVHKELRGTSYIIQLEGELDIATVDLLHEHVDHMAQAQYSSVMIDFSKLVFIDSTGIGAILRVIYLARDKGFAVELEGMNSNINEIFETVGVMRVLTALKKEDK